MRRWMVLALGIAVSAVFLYFGLQGVQLDEVAQRIGGADLIWLVPSVAIYFLAVWGRTWRWHYLLRPMKCVPLRALFPIVVIGYMGNNVYPFRAGEVIRAYVLKRNEQVSLTGSLATIVVERIFDGLVMLIFVFAALPFAPIEADWLRTVVIFGTLFFFGALAIFLGLAARPTQTQRLAHGAAVRLLPAKLSAPLLRLLDHFLDGLKSLRSPRDLLMTLLTSIFIWLTETTKYWFVMHAFHFEVSFFVLMLMTAVVNLATTLPAAPGYIGTFHTPGILVLETFRVNSEVAASYTIVLHAALWLPITLLGFVYLIREGLSWRSFEEATKAAEQAKHGAESPQTAETGEVRV
ncbi:MAG: lysylphosphatidylglycerol synthase transmembrane domain-containing protein [Anaerolineae bacterium]|nr:lysylphosphatidylglycerol synthase transmembrane domain-containing protein [Anaerolineae bacterium]